MHKEHNSENVQMLSREELKCKIRNCQDYLCFALFILIIFLFYNYAGILNGIHIT